MSKHTSIIIPTYNGGHKIGRLLHALQNQTVSDFEIIVVIDGSTDNTKDILAKYSNNFTALIVIEQDNAGRAKVKNRGARAASGNLLIFYDDDMNPEPDSVSRHIQFHATHSGILSGNQIEYISPEKPEVQNYKAHLTNKWLGKYGEGLTQLDSANLFFTAANCSVRKDTFLSLGGFDERLTDAEDYDLAWRAREKNIPVYFDKQNLAVHHDAITARSYIRRQRQYNEASARLLNFYPERKRKNSTREISFIKKRIYSVMASPALVRMIDAGIFKVLPQRIRYKLYDIIIQAMAIEFPKRPI
jgi:GT2 family glycosyltransferase